jgi:hypothetical protein
VGIGSVYAAHEDSLECLLASRHQQPLKTLYTGLGGLYLRPISDGTLIWTLPEARPMSPHPAVRGAWPVGSGLAQASAPAAARRSQVAERARYRRSRR